MAEERESTEIVWNDIPITVSIIREWPINGFCHIELKADQRLPITETGYRSHFIDMKYLEDYESHIEYVIAWLEDAAQSKEWKQHVEQSRQGNLFDL